MGRKRIGEGVGIILFLLLIVCGVQNRAIAEQVIDRITESVNAESVGEAAEPVPEQTDEQNAETAPEQTDAQGTGATPEQADAETSEQIKQILSLADSKLLGGYAVDESFFMWFASRFGEDVLADISQRIAEGETDPNMWYDLTSNSIHVLWMLYCRDLGYATYQLDNVVWKEANSSESTQIDFVGDINFDQSWYTMIEASEHVNGAAGCIDDAIKQELSDADITMVNNEFPYSLGGEPLAGKAYTFRADPMSVSLLGMFGTDIVSLANNHVWDYGQDALLDTLETLDEAGISHIGAGRDLSEAEQACYYIINGRKIAFVSATQIEINYTYTKEATEDSPGVLKTLDPEKFLSVIAEAKKNSDYVIAYVHWGTEGVLYSDAEQQALASSFVEAGADLIVGGHSHRLQGIYYIDGVPVINSLGNFWFSTGSLYTTVLQMTIDRQGDISIGLLPCVQEDLNVSLLSEEADVDDFYEYIADISDNISIGSDGVIHEGIYPDLYPYRSGVYYQSHSGSYDLEGRAIDIVGNLQ